jgi:hypothetical protein
MIFCDWPASERPKRPKIARKFDWSAPGYETLITQVFVKGDPQIEEDVVFTGSDNMVGDFKKDGDLFRLVYDFPLRRGVSTMPKAPIPA